MSTEQVGTEVIPGAAILLLKVPTKHVHYLGATLPTIET